MAGIRALRVFGYSLLTIGIVASPLDGLLAVAGVAAIIEGVLLELRDM